MNRTTSAAYVSVLLATLMVSGLLIPAIDAADTVPSEPFNLVAHRGDGQITLEWMQYENDITHYKVYRSITPGDELFLADVILANASSARSYVDRSVTNGQIYYYKVSAVNAFGESGLSLQELAAVPSNAPASIVLSIPSGSPGTELPFSGSGFDSNAHLSLLIDGEGRPWSVKTDPYGSFSTTFRVPNLPNGTHVLRLTDGVSYAETTFVAGEPTVVLGMERAAPGVGIPVSGYGFHASSRMGLWVGSSPVLWAVETDASGAFSGIVNLREQDVSTGTVTLEFRDQEGFSAFADILVGEPVVELGTDRAAPGAGVPVSGYGFHASSNIIFSVGSSDVLWYARTDASGAFSGTVSLREQDVITGTNTLSFRDEQGFSGSANILIGEPVVELGMERAAPGVAIPVSGYGFHASSIIDPSIGGSSILWHMETDASGAFSGTIVLPQGSMSDGANTLEFTDEEGYSASASILMGQPVIVLGQAGGEPGSVIAISGSGFAPSARLNLNFGSSHLLWPIDTDSMGSFSSSFTVPGDALGGTTTVTISDGAHHASAAFNVIYDDAEAPVTVAELDGVAASNGWYSSDVVVTLLAADVGSGVYRTQYGLGSPASWEEYTGPFTVTQSITVYFRSIDVAGNEEDVKSAAVSIDRAAPVSSAVAAGTSGLNGWYTSDVTITLSAVDEQSGVSGIRYRIDDGDWTTYSAPFTLTGEGITMVKYFSMDNAGNAESASSMVVKIDETAPIIDVSPIDPANANGWYNHAVDVQFTAADAVSGAVQTSYSHTFAYEGAAQSVSWTAVDLAGNTATVTIEGINIDMTAPKIVIATPWADDLYFLNEQVHADYGCIDSVSDIDVMTDSGAIDTSSVGTKYFTVTVTDLAGNANTTTVAYRVGYDYGGLSSSLTDRTFKAGSTIPLKFQLMDADGSFVTTTSAHVLVDDVAATASGSSSLDNSFRYDAGANQYVFNLSTKGLSSGTHTITIVLDDGTEHSVNVKLR